ncbi:MAG TPA: hypothetical protein VK902_20065 [Rubrobacter sp.]|nr:hypothetical protein [Rubrobacter sp.]
MDDVHAAQLRQEDPFQLEVQQSELDYVTTIAENYVGAALG